MKRHRVAVAALIAAVAAPAAFAQEAVQWRVEDGGNGHWYQVSASSDTDYAYKASLATALGGSLASISGPEENAVVTAAAQAANVTCRLVVGGHRSCTSCPWSWVDGSVWGFTSWGPGEPGNGGAVHVEMFIGFGPVGLWADVADGDGSCPAYVIEWSADCNGDGIVDYGQILLGELVDANANGVPDTCECDADINDDGVVNGADISVLLGYWGQSGKNVVGDLTGDGMVNGADLAQLLGSWGPCK